MRNGPVFIYRTLQSSSLQDLWFCTPVESLELIADSEIDADAQKSYHRAWIPGDAERDVATGGVWGTKLETSSC
jgi:hypothetical protein